MRMNVLWLGCIATLMSACNNDDPERKQLSSDYLPLEVGNYWDFRGVGTKTNDIVLHREVTGVADLNGHEYYMVISKVPSNATIIDSAYYRIDDDGDVFIYRKSMEIEELKYKLRAGDGDSWSYTYINNDVMDVTLHLGPVDTSSKTVDNCKNYYFDVQQWADEEHTNSLAPGVGFIREYSNAWGSGIILSKASIGGSVIEF